MIYAKYENIGKRVYYAGMHGTIMAVIGDKEYLIKTDDQAVFKVAAQYTDIV